MMDIVCVFCGRDVALQRLQARSIARYFERDGLGRLIYIWHDTLPTPDTLREQLGECLDGITFELLTASEFGVEQSDIATDGWTTQQALKLMAGRLVRTEFYLVLDAKNHFVSSCSMKDFIAEDGRGIFPIKNLAKNESYQYCLEYFDVDIPVGARRGVAPVTPFLLKTGIVQRLLETFAQKENRTVTKTFLRHQHKLSEFLAYQAYALSEGDSLCDLYKERRAHIAEILWAPIVQDSARFRRCAQQLESGYIKVLGLHWMACCLLSAEQSTRICKFWLSRSLVTSIQEARSIIDSVVNNLRVGDRKYLRKYLGGRTVPVCDFQDHISLSAHAVEAKGKDDLPAPARLSAPRRHD